MIEFILNDKVIKTKKPAGMTLLDFVRYDEQLTGTKIGCREGDCGACTILIGEPEDGQMKYKTMTSCITPLLNVAGKHVVTIEGLNMNELSPVQESMIECSGTQCGFCTVGFVMSLSGHCMEKSQSTYENGISAIDGNICRCTGYKAIERATEKISRDLQNKDVQNPIEWLVKNKYIPDYFSVIPEKLSALRSNGYTAKEIKVGQITVGGGTDLYVQRPEELMESNVNGYYDQTALKGIRKVGSSISVGAAVTVTDMLESEIFEDLFPQLRKHLKLVSSTPIRNMGTIAGNIINASPIGDMTIFFLALDSTLLLTNSKDQRRVKLRDFYQGYKTLDLRDNEYVESLEFEILNESSSFNFEKVSKRTYLDIASVNTALKLTLNGNTISEIHISAGGVGPIPKYLSKTSEYLRGKELNWENVQSAITVIKEDISPISDVRGSKEYKSLLLSQLLKAHFIELFPEKFEMEVLI